jgi:tRNA(fMet)-specific endonuclease VapC
MIYSLDTNVCAVLINGIRGFSPTWPQVRDKFTLARAAEAQFTISSIVVHELWYCVAKSLRVAGNAQRVSEFLEQDFQLLDFSARDAQSASQIRADLERKGTRIGEYDALIAGHALARGLTLVTANTREFSRVDGLKIIDWAQ